ncbi:MAG: NAD(P)/FAD-dependent oxidoreductase [Bacteroidia bacterium]|nr:NAD(P)/FAD-dependent oxidoreductase [Bacteroidia bacterium]
MERYDAVIIGSGMGGLCTAYIMAKEGMKVCVLEKNRQLGGSLQIFSRDKAIFDTGVHYIGALSPGQNLYRYFKYFGLTDALKLHKMGEDGFDIITFGGDENKYPHAQGYENFVEQLCKFFPEERDNLNLYIKKIREVCAAFPLYNLDSSGSKDFTNAWYLSVDTKAFIDSITKNKRLAEVLGGSNILYAGLENVTPFYVHALVVNSYIESSYRCIDGSSQITRHLSNEIKKMGGEIFNYSEAVRFHFKGDEIDEVELKNGERVAGKLFVSGIDLAKTVDMVEGPQLRAAYKNRIKSLENSCSSFIINAVVKERSFLYPNHNVYHYKIPNVWNGPSYNPAIWPEGIAVFPGTSSKHPDFADNFTAMAYMKFDEVKKWEHTFRTIPNYEDGRGQDYEDFKNEKAEKILKDVYERLPELKGNVKSFTAATPLTYRDYIGTRDGTLYGVIKDYNEPLKSFITPRTKVKNLFLTGQNINLHGVMGVTVNAVVTCSEIFGHPYLIDKVKAASE